MTVPNKLLIDQMGAVKMVLNENQGDKRLYAEGKVGQCDIPTANGRVYQRPIIEREIKRLQERINTGSLLGAVDHPGDGRCLGVGTPVMLASGQIVPVQDIKRGDRLMGPNGFRTVISTTTGRGPLYRITPVKGDSWVCNDKHILTLVHTSTGKIIDIELQDYIKSSIFFKSRYKLFSSEVETFEGESYTSELDPYFLGVWFGDGSKTLANYADGSTALRTVNVTKPDEEIFEICNSTAQEWDLNCKNYRPDDSCATWAITGVKHHPNALLNEMRSLVGSKVTIPNAIMYGSRKDRIAFLAGYLDTDGHLKHNCFYISQHRKDWADGIYFIAKSLGFGATLAPKWVTTKGKKTLQHLVTIFGDVDQIPTKIARRLAAPRKQIKNPTRTGFTVTSIGEGTYHGFELDGDGRFLLGDFTVTHNSRLMEAGHIVRKLWIESDGAVYGRFEIVEDSDSGRNLAAFLRRGSEIGMSSRGLGSTRINENGQEVVNEDFRLVTYDFVCDPAVSTAFPRIFSEDKEAESQLTAEHLKAKFPKLVRQIEESAYEVSRATTLEAMKSELEDNLAKSLETSKTAMQEQLRLELYPQIVKEMRDDFAAKLVRALQDTRKEIEEAVRSEMASDPAIAGAKITLEQVAKLVTPFTPPADVSKMLGEKDAALQKSNADLEEAKKVIFQNQAKLESTEATARHLGFQLFVEKALASRSDREDLAKAIGNTKSYNTVAELQEKVSSVISAADKANMLAEEKANARVEAEKQLYEKKLEQITNRAKKAEESHTKLSESVNTKISALATKLETALQNHQSELQAKEAELRSSQAKIAQLEEQVNRAVNLAENLELQNYTAKRTAGHPKSRDIMEDVQTGRLRSKSAINDRANASDIRADEPGGVSERIRRILGKGREHMSEEERVTKEKTTLVETPVPGLENQDITMEELRKLSGIQ